MLSAIRGSPGQELLQGLMVAGTKIYALSPDLEARGIASEKLLEGIGTVDYDGFVGLVEKHDVVPWL